MVKKEIQNKQTKLLQIYWAVLLTDTEGHSRTISNMSHLIIELIDIY